MSTFGSISGAHLRQFIERIERLEEEKNGISSDIREVYAEAKSHGYDPKIMRKVISLRKMNHQERVEIEELVDTYMQALTMTANPTPSETKEESHAA